MAVVPDNLPNDLKVTTLSPTAFRLWVLARCLCSANLTDGVIPAAALRAPLAARRKDVIELVDAGMWHELQSGAFVDHAYLEDNPTAADAQADRDRAAQRIETRRESNRVRQRRHRRGKSNASRNAPQGVTDGVTERDGNALRNASQSVTDGVTDGVTPEISPPHTPPLFSGTSGFSLISGSGSLPKPSGETDQVARASDGKQQAKRARKTGWTRVPEGWSPTAAHAALARERGLDLETQARMFRNHDFPRPRKDPDRTFENWLLGARGGRQSGPHNSGRAGDHADALFAEAERLRAEEQAQ